MRNSLLALFALVTSVSANAATLDINGTYVAQKCDCVESAEKKPCKVTPPALSVFAKSVLQSNPYVYPSESGATITKPDGSKKSVKMWVYKNSIGGLELKVREGDEVEISLAAKVNTIMVTATNKTLVQEPLSFPLQVPANSDGGEPGQPAKTDTKMDASGLVHNQTVGERYENNGTGEKGITYSTYFFMILKGTDGGLDIGRIADFKSKRDYSWSQPKTFNFEAQRCSFAKK